MPEVTPHPELDKFTAEVPDDDVIESHVNTTYPPVVNISESVQNLAGDPWMVNLRVHFIALLICAMVAGGFLMAVILWLT